MVIFPLATNMPAVPIAKKIVIDEIAKGKTLKEACALVGRTVNAYSQWRFQDEQFRRDVDRVREQRAAMTSRELVAAADQSNISFEEFSNKYLGMALFDHQRAWVDVIEGREPTLRPGEKFTAGKNRRRVLVNVPPFHGKSMTLTINYATYRICKNPNVRIIIVSKTQAQAKKFLYAIKKRLTDRRWLALQQDFAPPGGFKGNGEWSATKIYVGHSDSDEKDPTVEALGIGGQIYGARADLIILDDVADVGNAHEFDKQINWLDQDVDSRLYDGTLLVVGTRVGTQDIYSELMNGDRYLDGVSPWTHLAQPAVLQFSDKPEDWVTLWPRASRPLDEASEEEPGPDGLYAAWDGVRLARVRSSRSAKIWALVYQQQTATSEDQTFRPDCVWGSVDRRRKPGPLTPGGWGHPKDGGQGMYTIASMDPAMSGETFVLVMKVDRQSGKRWVENAWVQASTTTSWIQRTIVDITDEYKVNEWVIEKNAFQLYLIQDPAIVNPLNSRGVKIQPHYSGLSKIDPDFGVASVAALFGSTRRHVDGGRVVHNGDNLIELPDPDYSQGVKTLVEELLLWVPGKRGKDLRQDGPMALWFAEMRARQILGHGRDSSTAPTTHMQIPFMSRRRANLRATPPALRGLNRVF